MDYTIVVGGAVLMAEGNCYVVKVQQGQENSFSQVSSVGEAVGANLLVSVRLISRDYCIQQRKIY